MTTKTFECPKCRIDLKIGATECPCGWSVNKIAGRPSIASLRAEIVDVLRMGNVKDPDKHVEWFIDLLEPERKEEHPKQVQVVGNGREDNGYRWVWPYALRVKGCLLKYLTLSNDDKKIVMAARADNIFWRGDDIKLFMDVVEETMIMREIGVTAYRKQCLGKMKNLKIGG